MICISLLLIKSFAFLVGESPMNQQSKEKLTSMNIALFLLLFWYSKTLERVNRFLAVQHQGIGSTTPNPLENASIHCTRKHKNRKNKIHVIRQTNGKCNVLTCLVKLFYSDWNWMKLQPDYWQNSVKSQRLNCWADQDEGWVHIVFLLVLASVVNVPYTTINFLQES